MYEPRLKWVKVNGVIHHVSEYANLELWQRPDVYCPVCGRTVILKLGDIRAHHAAHYEGAVCVTTQPETAIHLNSKYYIQKVLTSTNNLKIWQKCLGWLADNREIQCHKESKKDVAYVQGWNRVEVEWPYGKYRLDVALLRDDQVIGAIEVLVTHPNEEGKIEYLNQQGIAWVEIRVTADFYSPPTAWTIETPLETENYNASLISSWQCKYCVSVIEARKKSVEKAKFYEERNRQYREEKQTKREYARQFESVAVRLIDFYYPSGKSFRKLYVIQKRYKQEDVLYMDLQEVTDTRRQIAIEHPPINDKSQEKLKQALEKDLNKAQRSNWIIDRSNPWRSASGIFNLKEYQFSDAQPYNYELVNDKWQKIPISNSVQKRPTREAFEIEIRSAAEAAAAEEEEENGIPSNSLKMNDALAAIFKEYTCTECGKITSDWISGNGATKTCICRECGYKKT